LQDAVADGDTRTISMHHLHTGESITITYKRDGRYDEAALNKLNWFLRDWRENKATRMDPHLIDLVWDVYRDVDATQSIQVICGYRDEHTNAMLHRRSNGVAQHSLHMRGMAMDFMIPGVPLEKLRVVGLRLQRGGVGYYPTSGSPFVHMDVGGVRHWPRMTREQLVRVFPDGRTVHIPTDGKPLKGYALALADLERRGGSPSGMSLATARNAGIDTDAVASAAPHKRSLLASIFGSHEEDEDESKPAVQAPMQVAAATPKGAMEAVPLPKTRPAQASMVVAMALPRVPSTSLNKSRALAASQTPNDIIRTRGYWVGQPDVTPAGATASRHLAARMAAAHGTDPMTTGGIPAGWLPSNSAAGDQRLAYAAQPERYFAVRRASRRSVVMRSVARATSIAVKAPRAQKAAPVPMLDPWLNAVAMTPSVRNYLSATQYGSRDFRNLQPFLDKPTVTVVMAFSEDPHHGLRADSFTGRAVVFVGTMTFAQGSLDNFSRTALLN
jgi:uncharacterized protein YcbK (DUF882 family)